ncbi:MAG: CotH kinase family protein [Bacteroidales bacterium]
MKLTSNLRLVYLFSLFLLIFGCTDQESIHPNLLDNTFYASPKAGNISVEINLKEKVTYSLSDTVDWINCSLEQGNLIITCTENEEDTERKAEIILHADANQVGTITVIQRASLTPALGLTSFKIRADKNSSVLTQDLNGLILKDSIALPFNYTPKSLKLIPSIETNADEVMFCIGQDTIRDLNQTIDFSKNIECLLRNKTGKSKSYKIQTRSNNGIPVVYIHTVGSAPIVSKDYYVGANIRFEGLGAYPSMEAAGKMKGRGNSTWGYPKKPYRIKFNEIQELAGFPAHKDWVLLANYIDPSLIKNALAFKISSVLDMEWSNRNVSVDTYLNGEYNGNYPLCEQIEISPNRVNIAELQESDITGELVTGGYLLELDSYFDEDQKFRSSVRNLPVMIKDPELNDIQFSWIKNHFNQVEQILYSDNFLDPVNGYRKYIDTESFIKWWLVYELMINDEPKHPKSSYMSKDRNSKFKMATVWDFDWYVDWKQTDGWINKSHIWYDRLFMDPQFVSEVKEIWNKNKGALTTEINNLLAQKEKEMALSAQKNKEVWHKNDGSSNKFNMTIQEMKLFFSKRLPWMDTAINNM